MKVILYHLSHQGRPLIIIWGVNTSWQWMCLINIAAAAKSLQSCPTLCDPIDDSPPGFPAGSDGKEPAHNAEDFSSIPELGRSPGERHGNPLQCSCLENPHGEMSLAGYSPLDHKESDITEWLRTAQHSTNCIKENILNILSLVNRKCAYHGNFTSQ